MKKSVILVLIIGLLVFCGAIYAIHQVTNQADEMTIECRVLEGEPQTAANIAFKIHNQWSERLDWEVQGSFDDKGEAHIEVLHTENWAATEQFRTKTFFNYRYDRNVGLYGSLQKNADYYTLILEPDCVNNLVWPYDPIDVISDFFKVKNLSALNLSFTSCGDVGTEGVYFSFHGRTNEKEYEPISIGCGNGIFLLPLTKDAEGEFVAETSLLKKVFELPEEDCYPITLLVDVQKENLLLFTKEKDKLVFRCIDIASMQEKVRTEVADFSEGAEISQLNLHEKEMFLILEDSTFAYFRKDNDCIKPQIISSLEAEGLRISSNWQLEYDWDYQDGRLAFLCEADAFYQASAYIFVFDQTGPLYKANIWNYADYSNDYGIPTIYLREDNPLEIWFVE